jgi:hypothetical protein
LWAALNKYWRPISRYEWIWGLSEKDIHNAILVTWNEVTKIPKPVYDLIWESTEPFTVEKNF